MTRSYIWIKGRKYYYQGTFDTYIEAYREAKQCRNKCGARWFILKIEKGFMFPETAYRLYMNKKIYLI